MRSNIRFHAGACVDRGSAGGLLRRPPIAPGVIALLLASLAGCAMSDGVGSFIVDPGEYSVYHCKDLVTRLKELTARETDLRNLMDKASEGGGGTLIGGLSYRPDYEKALGEEKVLRRTAAEKKCDLAPPAYQSDQVVR